MHFTFIPTVKYFRAVVSNGVCPVAYSDVVSVEYPSTTWNGTAWSNGDPDNTKKVIFAGNYTSIGDIEACSIQVNANNTITIASGHTLTVTNEVTVLGTPATTNLTFQNNASLIQINPIEYGLHEWRHLHFERPELPKHYWALSVNLAKGCVSDLSY